MKVKVEKEKCIGCGNCVALTDSKVFDFNDDNQAECILNKTMDASMFYGDVPKEFTDAVSEAIEFCPTSAIIEVNEENK